MNEKVRAKKEKRSVKQRIFLGKLFFDKEGNLKEVPVGIAAVLALIVLISLAVQVKEPAKETVVKVTHLFKSAPPPIKSQSAEAEKISGEKKQADRKERTNEKAKADKKMVAAEQKEQAEDELAKKEVSHKEAEKKGLEQKAELEDAEKRLKKAEVELKNTEEAKKALKETIQLAKTEGDEKDNTLKEILGKSKEVKAKAVDTRDKSETVREEAIQFNKSSDYVKEKSSEVSSQLTAIADAGKWSGVKEKITSLKISDEEYAKLYRTRFASGAKKPETKYRWRVSNQYRLKLKDCYTLFDMKAVAITADGKYYDLSDLSQLTKDYLNNNYSSTVILSENPEVDFRNEIEKLNLTPQDLTVRYYMYNHTRNYFYHRVEQAVKCCLQQGEIPEEENWEEHIDVVGNVYKIEKEDGRFGVFIPTSVYYRGPDSRSAKEIQVPPSCFENGEDVKILKAKNLL